MFTELDKVMTVFQNFLIQKQYSPNTIKTYCNYFKDYLSYFKGSEYQNITKDLINRYILTLVKEKKISVSQQNQRINAIKFYYEKVLKRKKEYIISSTLPFITNKTITVIAKEVRLKQSPFFCILKEIASSFHFSPVRRSRSIGGL